MKLNMLKAGTCLSSIAAVLMPACAMAQTTIEAEVTKPVVTSSAGDVSISEDGSIVLDGGAAITVDSPNDVTNEGSIELGDGDGASGMTFVPGITANLDNIGTIEILEDFDVPDEDGNSIADGPIAGATGRHGVYVAPGGVLTGSIDNSGTITVEGLQSGGIVLASTLDGSLSHSGAISVIGDSSVGISTADVTGDVAVTGSVIVSGEGATAIAINGDIGGSLLLQNTIAQTSSFTDDDGNTVALSRGDLRSGNPAVSVAGDVAGGIVIGVPPTDDDDDDEDEDEDGVEDAEEGSGAITAYGTGAALSIGSEEAIAIGATSDASGGHSLEVDGTITSYAVHSNNDTVALLIGGQGGAVDMSGGIGVSGTIQATTDDSGATAILIAEGANVPLIDNSGIIVSSITAQGDGSSYAIRDLSGTLTTINNNGYITASGSYEDAVVAIDLSANGTGVLINQYSSGNDDTDADGTVDEDEEAVINTSINGDILLGSGDDLITVSDGRIAGDSQLGAGDDAIRLSGDAVYLGDAHFGAGAAALSLSDTSSFTGTLDVADQDAALRISDSASFLGDIEGGSALAVDVTGGSFGASSATELSFSSLHVGADGTLSVHVDTDSGTNSLVRVDQAQFDEGSQLAVSVSSLDVEGEYLVLAADELVGAPSFSESEALLPFLLAGNVTADEDAGEILLEIRQKTAEELGLNAALTSAYPAALALSGVDEDIEASFLEIADAETLATQLSGLLPDYSDGNFDLAVRGSRLIARHLTDDRSVFADDFATGMWLEGVGLSGGKATDSTAGYDLSAFGLSTGYEAVTGIGNVGLSFGWLSGGNDSTAADASIDASQYELGAFWRISKGKLYAFARGSAAYISYGSERTFTGTVDETDFTRTTAGDWHGYLYSGALGASYNWSLGRRLSILPKVAVDYYKLQESGYSESGDGAIDLTVASRDSDALSATTTATVAYALGRSAYGDLPLTFELEAGRRNVLDSSLGATTAHFVDGEDFTLAGGAYSSGWLGEARLRAGGYGYSWLLAAGAEEGDGKMDVTVRASLAVGF